MTKMHLEKTVVKQHTYDGVTRSVTQYSVVDQGRLVLRTSSRHLAERVCREGSVIIAQNSSSVKN